jgi:HK97 family phage major capsid protein
MKTLEELRARLAEVQDELRGLHAEAGDGDLDTERQAEWDTLSEELGTLKADIKRREDRISTVRALGEAGNVEAHRAPAVHVKTEDRDLYNLDELRLSSSSAEDFVRRATDNAKRAIERASFGASPVRGTNKEDMQGHAEELIDTVDNRSGDLAKRMLATGSAEYERAFTKLLRSGNDALCTMEEREALIRANQSLGTDTEGGYAVPFQLDPTVILTSAGVVNPIRELARVERIVGKEWQGVTSAGTSVTRAAEADEAPDTTFTLGQPVVRTNRVQGFVTFSMEIDLSWNALRSEITRMLVDAKGREEESFTTGTGSGTAPQGINGGLGSGQNVLTSGAVDTFTGTQAITDLYRLEEALDARWEPNAAFLAHKSVYNTLRQVDSAGGANLWVRVGDGTPARLLDYPNYRSTALPTVTSAAAGTANAANSTLMIFGDFKQFLIVDRIGMTVEMVPHVLGANRRPTGQRGVYAVWMNNSKILVPDAFRRLSMKQA